VTFNLFADRAGTFSQVRAGDLRAERVDVHPRCRPGRAVAGQLRSGIVGHDALETKFVILEGRPAGYENTEL
jgi:hypothetical protein